MNRLKEVRKRKGLTLKALGEEVGLAGNTLSQYENGKREPKIEIWKKIANVLNVPVPYLQGMGTSRDEMLEFLIELYWRYYLETDEKYLVDEDSNISEFLDLVITKKDTDKIYSFMVPNRIEFETDEDIKKAGAVVRERFDSEILFLNDYNKLITITEKLDPENLELIKKIYNFIEEDGFKSRKELERQRKKELDAFYAKQQEERLKEYGFNVTPLFERVEKFKEYMIDKFGVNPDHDYFMYSLSGDLPIKEMPSKKELKEMIDEFIASLQQYSDLLK